MKRPVTLRRKVFRCVILITVGVGVVVGGRIAIDSLHDRGTPLRWVGIAERLGLTAHIPGLPSATVIQGLLDRGYSATQRGLHLGVYEWNGSTTCVVTLDGEGSRLIQVHARVSGIDQETWGRALMVQLVDVCFGDEGYQWACGNWEKGGEFVLGEARAVLVRSPDESTLTVTKR